MPYKTIILLQIVQTIVGISSIPDDIMGRLESVLLTTIATFRRDADEDATLIESVKILRKRLLDRFKKNPLAFVDRLLRVSDIEMVIFIPILWHGSCSSSSVTNLLCVIKTQGCQLSPEPGTKIVFFRY